MQSSMSAPSSLGSSSARCMQTSSRKLDRLSSIFNMDSSWSSNSSWRATWWSIKMSGQRSHRTSDWRIRYSTLSPLCSSGSIYMSSNSMTNFYKYRTTLGSRPNLAATRFTPRERLRRTHLPNSFFQMSVKLCTTTGKTSSRTRAGIWVKIGARSMHRRSPSKMLKYWPQIAISRLFNSQDTCLKSRWTIFAVTGRIASSETQ